VTAALVAFSSSATRSSTTRSSCGPRHGLLVLQTKAPVDGDIEAQRNSLKAQLEREALRNQLFRVCAACNRGFGASERDRANVNVILASLVQTSPFVEPTSGIAGSEASKRWVGRGLELSDSDGTVADGPLEGVWRLIYTNATDVLSLGANPLAGVGEISQHIALPDSIVNVIDFYPRASALLPPGMLRTSTQLRVSTRARAWSATRIGLTFEKVDVEARALLGMDVTRLIPQLSVRLPRLPGSDAAGADSDESPAYFEVAYLDRELLIIQQNQPGGTFALVRETADELRMRDMADL